MVDKDATATVSGEVIGFPLLIFVAGIAASAFASGGTYFTNYLYVAASSLRFWDYKHPYVYDTRGSRICARIGELFHVVSVILVLCSYGLFVYGAYVSRDMVIAVWTSGQKASNGTTASRK